MTIPLVTPLPSAPNRATQPEGTFDDAADLWTAAVTTFSDEVNDVGEAMNSTATTITAQAAQVSTDTAEVETARDAIEEIWAAVVAEATAGASGTSASAITIGTGVKSFAANTGKLWSQTMAVIIRSAASAANFMYGEITSYDVATGALNVRVDVTGGSGSHSDWAIYPVGGRYGGTWTEADTEATTSGTSVTFSDLDDLPYDDLILECLGVSANGVANLQLELSDNGTDWTSPVTITALSDAGTRYGAIHVPGFRRAAGAVHSVMADLSSNRTIGTGTEAHWAWRIAAGITHIRISTSSGAFDAGSIKLLGRV